MQANHNSHGEVDLDWTAAHKDSEYTLVHTVRHGGAATEAEERGQTTTQPPRPAPQQWTLYRLLAHARTLGEHSIQPYTDVTYVERMLQDWTKYETEVVEGHTGPPDTTPRAAWEDLVPDGDIGALAKLVQNTAPNHPFEDNYDPTIVTAILAYHSWTTKQHVHLHTASDDTCESHSIGPPALEVSLHKNTATAAHPVLNLRPVAPQRIPEPCIPPSPM